MNMIGYTFSVVRYVHDPAAGEALNVGVLLCAPDAGFLSAKLEYRFERLSEAFADFNGEHYRRVLRQIEAALTEIRERRRGSLFHVNKFPADVGGTVSEIMPDRDLAIQFGAMLAGITFDPEEELNSLFERMVSSQYDWRRADKRTDDEVWSIYQRSLVQRRIKRYLQPKKFEAADYEIRFEHAFKNERWHVLQPATMDYARPEGIQNKATRLLGTATALSGNRELETLYLLLGKPQERKHLKHYEKAKSLLHKMPVKHKVIEEDEAEDFAADLESYMRRHGVIEDAE